MKYFYLFFFIIILSCGTSRQTFMCGDNVCADKKEYNEYFAKNLIIEVQINTSKKKKKIGSS